MPCSPALAVHPMAVRQSNCDDVLGSSGEKVALDLPDASLVGIVAFYSIVHFGPAELGAVFQEARRVLMPGGLALISFHLPG